MSRATTLTEVVRVVILGAGGHARVVQEALAGTGVTLAGFIAPSAEGSALDDVPWLGGDEAFATLDATTVQLVNGVGSASTPAARERIFADARRRGFTFRTVIDSTAIVRPSAALGEGVQVLAGAVVGTDVVLGDDVIVNTGAIVDHHCVIEAHCHVSPGVAIAGNVTVGGVSHIGIGSRVIQGVAIGSHCTIGAGAVVLADVPDRSIAIGIPATSKGDNSWVS
jgi:sugar O-acyltransferase (sialic acid O-acetyltransferase NeuD family)